MKRTIAVTLCALVILAMTATLVGCTGSTDMENAESAYEAEFGKPPQAAQMGSGVDPLKDGEEPDSHQVMAMMILQGAGKNADLSAYESVTLVPMTGADGAEFNAVVLDESDVVFPASIKGDQ